MSITSEKKLRAGRMMPSNLFRRGMDGDSLITVVLYHKKYFRRKTDKKYKNTLTYLISMLLYNHVANTYKTDMNNGGIIYEQDFK